MKSTSISQVLMGLPISRLTHFTPARNLPHILRDGMIRSSKDLAENAPEAFSPTDRQRWDAHPGHVCCSFEYPNVYYLRQAREKPEYANYRDWVCLLLNPQIVERDNTLFAQCNAARAGGLYLEPGADALAGLWTSPSTPQGWTRGPRHHPAVPTDMQAEALVPGPILLSDVHAVVVEDAPTAADLYGTLERWSLNPERLRWKVAPKFFQVNDLVNALRFGGSINEHEWKPEENG